MAAHWPSEPCLGGHFAGSVMCAEVAIDRLHRGPHTKSSRRNSRPSSGLEHGSLSLLRHQQIPGQHRRRTVFRSPSSVCGMLPAMCGGLCTNCRAICGRSALDSEYGGMPLTMCGGLRTKCRAICGRLALDSGYGGCDTRSVTVGPLQ